MTMDIIAYSHVVDEMGLEMERPYTLEMDNEAARIFINGSGGRTKLKHIDCRMEWVLLLRDKSIIEPVHVDTSENLADIFTKILPPATFIGLRDRCMSPCPM